MKIVSGYNFSKNLPVYLLLILISLSMGYFVRNRNTTTSVNSTVITSPSPTYSVPNQNDFIQSVLSKLTSRDKDIMNLFTPPTSKAESETYSYLMGLDLPNKSERLYSISLFSYKISEAKVLSTTEDSGKIIVRLEQMRNEYDNTSGKWNDTKTDTYILEIIKEGVNYFVDRYYKQSDSPQKYSGFY